jgi:hypothetical protein
VELRRVRDDIGSATTWEFARQKCARGSVRQRIRGRAVEGRRKRSRMKRKAG